MVCLLLYRENFKSQVPRACLLIYLLRFLSRLSLKSKAYNLKGGDAGKPQRERKEEEEEVGWLRCVTNGLAFRRCSPCSENQRGVALAPGLGLIHGNQKGKSQT